MTYGYPSIGQAMGGAAPFAASQCRCAQQCFCPPGQPCRCRGGCSCRQAQGTSRAAAWREAQESEGELARRRGALRARAYSLLQRRSALQNDWRRRARLNGMFARRFSFAPYLPRVARALGSPSLRPDSNRFMFALARWQNRYGLPANGLLTPRVWRTLLGALGQRPPRPAPWPLPWPAPWPAMPAGAAAAGWPAGAPAAPWPPSPGAQPGIDSAAGLAPDAAPDDPAMPLPGDEGAPDAPPSEEMWPGYGLGFRARHPAPY